MSKAASPAMKQKILIVDDEPDALELIEVNLKSAGYDIVTAANGTEALRKAHASSPDLILLDVMLPALDGLQVCKSLRSDPRLSFVPIIMLTARTAEIDRVLGLELGADDYITKPFSPRELVLRVKNLLKRRASESVSDDQVHFAGFVIDRPRHLITYEGRPLDLTVTEFRLVTLLAERRGRVQSREQLLKDVWGYNSLIDTRTVDTHMRRLRDKLGDAARYLDTVRGVGYRFLEK
jgi:two-component system phosphate regulon response regulator PhoB